MKFHEFDQSKIHTADYQQKNSQKFINNSWEEEDYAPNDADFDDFFFFFLLADEQYMIFTNYTFVWKNQIDFKIPIQLQYYLMPNLIPVLNNFSYIITK